MTIIRTQSFLSEKPGYYWNRQGFTTYQYELNLEFNRLLWERIMSAGGLIAIVWMAPGRNRNIA